MVCGGKQINNANVIITFFHDSFKNDKELFIIHISLAFIHIPLFLNRQALYGDDGTKLSIFNPCVERDSIAMIE